jgi:hypothetical protein
MDTIVVCMLLGWLGCTAVMTVRAVRKKSMDDIR